MGIVRIKLDKYLEQRGLTRNWLSRKTDIKYQTITNYYKNSVGRCDFHNLTQICDALECDISDIIEYVKD